MTRETDLAALVATRICHDLASPVGAVANVADMMRETGPVGMADDLKLLCKTADRGAALLKLYRLVLGGKVDDEPGVMHTTLVDLLACLEVPGRTSLSLHSQHASIDGPTARLAGLMMMAGSSILGLRGELSLTINERGPAWLVMTTTGARIDLTDEKRALLIQKDASATKPSLVEFSMIRQILARIGADLTFAEGENILTITVAV